MNQPFHLSIYTMIQLAWYACITMAAETPITLELPSNGLGAKGRTHVNVTTLLDWPDTRSFLHHAKNSEPFIARGVAKRWPAYAKWTDKYFSSFEKEGGDEGVTVEKGKKESRDNPAEELSFHKFVQDYQQKDWYMVNSMPHFLRFVSRYWGNFCVCLYLFRFNYVLYFGFIISDTDKACSSLLQYNTYNLINYALR